MLIIRVSFLCHAYDRIMYLGIQSIIYFPMIVVSLDTNHFASLTVPPPTTTIQQSFAFLKCVHSKHSLLHMPYVSIDTTDTYVYSVMLTLSLFILLSLLQSIHCCRYPRMRQCRTSSPFVSTHSQNNTKEISILHRRKSTKLHFQSGKGSTHNKTRKLCVSSKAKQYYFVLFRKQFSHLSTLLCENSTERKTPLGIQNSTIGNDVFVLEGIHCF